MTGEQVYPEFDAYVANQPEACRTAIYELRRTIGHTLLETEQLFNCGIPASTLVPWGQARAAGHDRWLSEARRVLSTSNNDEPLRFSFAGVERDRPTLLQINLCRENSSLKGCDFASI